MNYVVLEGISLYLVLIMIVLILAISIGCVICVILSDKRGFVLENLLIKERKKVCVLVKENFVLKLKCGEFEIDEE